VLRLGESIQINDPPTAAAMCTGVIGNQDWCVGRSPGVGIAIKAASSAKFRHPRANGKGTPIAV